LARRSGATDPARIVARSYARRRALNDSAVFILLCAASGTHVSGGIYVVYG
jgi:hypothetical protein